MIINKTKSLISIAAGLNVKDYGAVGDGTTNDYTAIAAAISAASSAGGGVVFIPRGTFITGQTITVPANVNIVGENKYTSILKSNTSGGYSLFSITSSNILLSNFRMEGPAAGTLNGAANINTCSNVVIRNCSFNNRFLITLLIGNDALATTDCGVVDCHFEGSSSEQIEFIDANYCYADRNYISSAGANGIIFFRKTLGAYNVGNRATNNIVRLCRVGITCGGGNKTQILGNQVYSCTQAGITAQVGNVGTSIDGVCSNNQVDGCNAADQGHSNYGISASGWTINSNISKNCAGTGAGGNGFYIGGTQNTVVGNKSTNESTNGLYVEGDRNYTAMNTIIDPSGSGVGARDGIQAYGKYCTYKGNITYDTRGGSARMRYGIFLTSNSQSCILESHTGNVGTGGLLILDAGTSNLIYGNYGDVAPVTVSSALLHGIASSTNTSFGASFGELNLQYASAVRASMTSDANNNWGETVGGAGVGGVKFLNGGSAAVISGNAGTLNLNGSGRPVSVGLATAGTAQLNIKAGSTAMAPLNIPDGVAPTSPNNGDVWFVGDVMYRRIGGVTKSLTFT